MASPVDAGRATTSITSTAAGDWTINLPATIASGNLLVCYTRNAGLATSISTFTGWTFLFRDASDASDDTTEVWFKIATGGEGATDTISWNAASKGGVIVWRITGSAAVTPVEASAVTTTTAANIDPASFTPSAPGGSKDYLWLSVIGMDSETATATNGTLSNVVSANSGTTGAVATNCIIWAGSLASTASSINIAAWTSTAPNSGASAWTLAIYPVAAAAATFGKPELALQAVNRASVW